MTSHALPSSRVPDRRPAGGGTAPPAPPSRCRAGARTPGRSATSRSRCPAPAAGRRPTACRSRPAPGRRRPRRPRAAAASRRRVGEEPGQQPGVLGEVLRLRRRPAGLGGGGAGARRPRDVAGLVREGGGEVAEEVEAVPVGHPPRREQGPDVASGRRSRCAPPAPARRRRISPGRA